MGNAPHTTAPGDGKTPGYETRDANVNAIVLYGAILAVVVIGSFLFVTWLFNHELKLIHRDETAPSMLMETNLVPPTPRLRVNAVKELNAMHAAEDILLTSYNWIDRDAGIVRIPVARAMELVAERGLPTWPLPPGAVPADTNAPAAGTNAVADAAAPAGAPAPGKGAP